MNAIPPTGDVSATQNAFVLRQIENARAQAQTARQVLEQPANDAARRTGIAACYEAAEHLNDVNQVDIPAELVEDIRHALDELRGTIATLGEPERPGIQPPGTALAGTIARLEALEHKLRAQPPTTIAP
jgi:hypothetical protein